MFKVTGGDSKFHLLVLDDFEAVLKENSVNIDGLSSLLQCVVREVDRTYYDDAYPDDALQIAVHVRDLAVSMARENAPRLYMVLNKYSEASVITYTKDAEITKGRPKDAFVLVLSCPMMVDRQYFHTPFPTFQ